jgi:hypothetical protein
LNVAYRVCSSIHPITNPITNPTTNPISSSERFLPFSIRCHLYRHPRQQVAVAYWAMNTGCPLLGVCLPSFLGTAGANRVVMKSIAWDRMVSMLLEWMYSRSLSVNLNRERNLDFLRAVRAVVIWLAYWFCLCCCRTFCHGQYSK